MSVRAGEVICDIIASVIKCDNRWESSSSENTLHKQENAEKVIKEKGENVMNGSIDTISMYDRLNVKEITKEVNTKIRDSDITLQNINYRTPAILVAMTYSPTQIRKAGLQRIIPARKYKKVRSQA